MDRPVQMIEQVPAAAWQEWVAASGAAIVDVREPIEWQQGTLAGSREIALMTLPERMGEFDRDTPLLVVCRSGSRSQMAARFLAANGFTRVANLAGGLETLGMTR